MAHKHWCRLLALLGSGVISSVLGDGSGPWRIYRATDGLAESATVAVTVSPRGNLWARHSNGGPISWSDGFQIHAIQDSSVGNFPAYESRSGQVWSLYGDGVMEYRRDQWFQYPLADIRTEIQSSSLRLVRPIPLLPAERDHVLVLLPELLLKFDAVQQSAVPLRLAKNTRIGRFNDLDDARDGGAWLSGSNGLAKLPTPLRRFAASSTWDEFIPNKDWQVHNFERPFEDDEGGVTVAADSLLSGGRVVLYYNGRDWETPIPAPDRIRNAWRGSDQNYWAFTRTSLFRRESDRWDPVKIPGIRDPQLQFFDVAILPNGIFWLATSEGLVRFSPPTWRTPPELGAVKAATRSILEDPRGRIWFGGADNLRVFQDGKWESIPWPQGASETTPAPESIYLAAGRVVFQRADRLVQFNPATRVYSTFAHPRGRSIKALLGPVSDDRLCVETTGKEATNSFFLEAFDGKEFTKLFEPGPDWSLGNNLSIFQESEERGVWIGGSDGLGFVDIRADPRVATRLLASGPVTCLLEVARGKVWCGGDKGLYEFDGKGWTHQPMVAGRVHSMRKALDGSVWVASSSGVYRYLDGSWVSNSTLEGLPGSMIYDVLPDRHGNVWAATARGISLYHPTADTDPPDCSVDVESVPRDVSSVDRVTLSFGGRDKWDQTPENRILFSHRLDERPWTPFDTNQSAVFTNLLAGKHRFELRAMDRNWNEQPQFQSIEFTAVIPWYRELRLVAMAIAALILTAGLAALAVNRHFRLVRSYAEVGRIVEQRTHELEKANQELLHSQKMRALGALAAGIAHDFNNILSIIKGSAQIIESNTEDPEKIRTRVDRIKTVVDQGTSIVKAMLGFSRVSDRKKTECDLNQLVVETTRLVGDQFLKGITLRLDTAASLPKVKAAGELIQQMLLNLIINAADAMEGHGEIVLQTSLLDHLPPDSVLTPAEAREFVGISVQDTGSGIPPEILSRIFEPFFTTKALSTRRGTGLGLSMVYEIAKELGCGIHVKSIVGQGSTFTIVISLPANPRLDSHGLSGLN